MVLLFTWVHTDNPSEVCTKKGKTKSFILNVALSGVSKSLFVSTTAQDNYNINTKW